MVRNPVSRWFLINARKLLRPRRQGDYLVLTPPFFSRQRVLNRRTRAVRTYEMRGAEDVAVLHQVFMREDYALARLRSAKAIAARYEEILAAGRTPLIVDCGANIGLSAAYFSEQYPRARILAIEPEGANVAQARRNCPHANVELIEAAVSAEPGRGALVDPGLGSWGFRVQSDAAGAIRFVSIPELLARHPQAEPFIVKIDIEGHEKELFARNAEWADRFYVLIIELHDW
ncbi:MAG: FkbM family methyltransferase, partial [Burkholderiales bacterium]